MPVITIYVPEHLMETLKQESARLAREGLSPTKMASRLIGVGVCASESESVTAALLERLRVLPAVPQSPSDLLAALDPDLGASPSNADAALNSLQKLDLIRPVILPGGKGIGWVPAKRRAL